MTIIIVCPRPPPPSLRDRRLHQAVAVHGVHPQNPGRDGQGGIYNMQVTSDELLHGHMVSMDDQDISLQTANECDPRKPKSIRLPSKPKRPVDRSQRKPQIETLTVITFKPCMQHAP